jgi:hypothetical protein
MSDSFLQTSKDGQNGRWAFVSQYANYCNFNGARNNSCARFGISSASVCEPASTDVSFLQFQSKVTQNAPVSSVTGSESAEADYLPVAIDPQLVTILASKYPKGMYIYFIA